MTTDVDEIDALLKQACDELITRMELYDRIAPELERRCREHLQRYLTADPPRAPEIQDAASRSQVQIDVFLGSKAALVMRAGMVLSALDLKVARITTALIDDARRGAGLGQQLSAAKYDNEAIAAGMIAIEGIRLATPVYAARVALLSGYLGDSEEADALDVFQAMVKAANTMGREKLIETMVDILAPPAAAVVRTALKYYAEVRAELKKLEMPYSGYSDVDHLFEFRAKLDAARLAVDEIGRGLLVSIEMLASKDSPRATAESRA